MVLEESEPEEIQNVKRAIRQMCLDPRTLNSSIEEKLSEGPSRILQQGYSGRDGLEEVVKKRKNRNKMR